MTIVIRLALEGSSGGETVLVFVTEEETKKEVAKSSKNSRQGPVAGRCWVFEQSFWRCDQPVGSSGTPGVLEAEGWELLDASA